MRTFFTRLFLGLAGAASTLAFRTPTDCMTSKYTHWRHVNLGKAAKETAVPHNASERQTDKQTHTRGCAEICEQSHANTHIHIHTQCNPYTRERVRKRACEGGREARHGVSCGPRVAACPSAAARSHVLSALTFGQ